MHVGVSFEASAFRIMRLFRLLQLEHFVSAFTLLDDVWRGAKSVLAAAGLLALIVWIGAGTLFYLFEQVKYAVPVQHDMHATCPRGLGSSVHVCMHLAVQCTCASIHVCGLR